MAGRARTIKPEILADEKTAMLNHLEWRLFVSVWLIADDYGNLRGEPALIRAHTLWAADSSITSVAAALETLASVSLLSRYSVRGQSYFHITNWERHQRIDRPSKPQMPGQDEADGIVVNGATQTNPSVAANPREPVASVPREPRETLVLDRKGEEGRVRRASGARDSLEPLRGDFVPDPEARQIARDRNLDLEIELAKFRNWAKAKKPTSADWQASFCKWLLSAKATTDKSARLPKKAARQTGPERRRMPGPDGLVEELEYEPSGEIRAVKRGG